MKYMKPISVQGERKNKLREIVKIKNTSLNVLAHIFFVLCFFSFGSYLYIVSKKSCKVYTNTSRETNETRVK